MLYSCRMLSAAAFTPKGQTRAHRGKSQAPCLILAGRIPEIVHHIDRKNVYGDSG